MSSIKLANLSLSDDHKALWVEFVGPDGDEVFRYAFSADSCELLAALSQQCFLAKLGSDGVRTEKRGDMVKIPVRSTDAYSVGTVPISSHPIAIGFDCNSQHQIAFGLSVGSALNLIDRLRAQIALVENESKTAH